jgi:hypothetical protein
MANTSLAHPAQEESPELLECFRHEGEEYPRCDGSGFRPRRYCAGCGEPAGRPSEGGKALMGMPNVRGSEQPMWCLQQRSPPCKIPSWSRAAAFPLFARRPCAFCLYLG